VPINVIARSACDDLSAVAVRRRRKQSSSSLRFWIASLTLAMTVLNYSAATNRGTLSPRKSGIATGAFDR